MVAIRVHYDGKAFVPDEPVEFAPGQRLVVRVESETPPSEGTAQDLLSSGLVGVWAHRDDIKDSSEYARDLRRQAERRQG